MVLNPNAQEPKFHRKLLRPKTEGKEVQAESRITAKTTRITNYINKGSSSNQESRITARKARLQII